MYRREDFDNAPHTVRGRRAYLRLWATEFLKKNSAVERFFHVDRTPTNALCATLFTLSSDNRLVEEMKDVRDVPVWTDN